LDDVDTEPPVVERDAVIDEHDVPVLLEREAVHADLSEAAERKDPEHDPRLSTSGLVLWSRADVDPGVETISHQSPDTYRVDPRYVKSIPAVEMVR
jgi:hypothetical protein